MDSAQEPSHEQARIVPPQPVCKDSQEAGDPPTGEDQSETCQGREDRQEDEGREGSRRDFLEDVVRALNGALFLMNVGVLWTCWGVRKVFEGKTKNNTRCSPGLCSEYAVSYACHVRIMYDLLHVLAKLMCQIHVCGDFFVCSVPVLFLFALCRYWRDSVFYGYERTKRKVSWE